MNHTSILIYKLSYFKKHANEDCENSEPLYLSIMLTVLQDAHFHMVPFQLLHELEHLHPHPLSGTIVSVKIFFILNKCLD